ncbi:hypothetical protein HGG70_07345 [Rhodobacteraceae bacterium R_SAG4]|nr:hypothetical protein [Rhodobacteraceae bacterium R_SAG4]
MTDQTQDIPFEASDWILFNATLTRKTTEQLQIWTDRYDRGVITASAMLSVLSALYDATSGMIEKDVSDLMADLHADLIRELKTPR